MTGDPSPKPCIIWLPQGPHCLELTTGPLLRSRVLMLLPSAYGNPLVCPFTHVEYLSCPEH